jgi:hypothetical protein
MGKPQYLLQMLEDIFRYYHVNPDNEEQLSRIRSDQYLFSRFYADTTLGAIALPYRISLDRKQEVFGCTGGRMTTLPWPLLHPIQAFLFSKYERRFLKTFSLTPCQMFSRDYVIRNGKILNKKYGSSPPILHFPGTYERFQVAWKLLRDHVAFSRWSLLWPIAVLISFVAWIRSLGAYAFIFYINKGETRPEQIFRFGRHGNHEFEAARERLTAHLQKGEAFAYGHFNDGELTFLGKLEAEDHEASWFGRKQHQYDKQLAKRLKSAIQYRQDRYYVGVPCSICHPEHRKLADALVPDHPGKLPAMTLHHQLSILPVWLRALLEREVFFVINEYQSLELMRALGIEVKKDHIITVPYLNAYREFDRLKNEKFPPGAVVLMTCGMLAKILLPLWYGKYPKTTFIALGSAIDDFIQPKRMKFRLFPKDFPMTRNLRTSRSFLFGRKRNCPECFLPKPLQNEGR